MSAAIDVWRLAAALRSRDICSGVSEIWVRITGSMISAVPHMM
jgi:hypothetical protein